MNCKILETAEESEYLNWGGAAKLAAANAFATRCRRVALAGVLEKSIRLRVHGSLVELKHVRWCPQVEEVEFRSGVRGSGGVLKHAGGGVWGGGEAGCDGQKADRGNFEVHT